MDNINGPTYPPRPKRLGFRASIGAARDRALERFFPRVAAARRQAAVNRRWREMNAADQIVVMAQILKASPELRALFRDALNVKGREELTGAKPRKLWTPGSH